MSNICIATQALSHILDDFQVYTQISNVLCNAYAQAIEFETVSHV
jgi:hypothetical protein